MSSIAARVEISTIKSNNTIHSWSLKWMEKTDCIIIEIKPYTTNTMNRIFTVYCPIHFSGQIWLDSVLYSLVFNDFTINISDISAQFVERSVSAINVQIHVKIKLSFEKINATNKSGTAVSTATPETIGSARSLYRR